MRIPPSRMVYLLKESNPGRIYSYEKEGETKVTFSMKFSSTAMNIDPSLQWRCPFVRTMTGDSFTLPLECG